MAVLDRIRQYGVEQCGPLMQPLLQNPAPVYQYAKGWWDPEAPEKANSVADVGINPGW